MTLIEVLVAMLVLTLGLLALVAAFTSGILTIQRAAKASTAASYADDQMETYKQGTFASIPIGTQAAVTKTGPNGATYWLQATNSWTCPIGTLVAGPPPSCTTVGTAARPVKQVSIVVRDSNSSGRVLASQVSTFDSSTG
jgi:Tfp pilus assembly protein PilV